MTSVRVLVGRSLGHAAGLAELAKRNAVRVHEEPADLGILFVVNGGSDFLDAFVLPGQFLDSFRPQLIQVLLRGDSQLTTIVPL